MKGTSILNSYVKRVKMNTEIRDIELLVENITDIAGIVGEEKFKVSVLNRAGKMDLEERDLLLEHPEILEAELVEDESVSPIIPRIEIVLEVAPEMSFTERFRKATDVVAGVFFSEMSVIY